MLKENTLKDLLPSVCRIAEKAGGEIMKIYSSSFEVETKNDNSPLTAADLAAHRCIVRGLAQLADYPMLSEESNEIPYSERSKWETYWLVDPLDGTKEFIKRNGDFTVNIALIHNHKPVLGVVYVPVSGKIYYAAEGVGAFVGSSADAPLSLRVRPLNNDDLVVVGSRSHVTEELQAYLDKLPPHRLHSVGSSLKFCMLAEGKADIYPRLGLTSEWDTAAAQCVVEQAGGVVIDLQGENLQYNRKESLLNPFFLVIADNGQDWLAYVNN